MTAARWLTAAVAVVAAILVPPSAALADPAGPTDFRTMVTSVEPPLDAISITVEGGDAFMLLVVQPGHEVTVLGYGGEPYIRVNTDGTVEENQLSPATFYNEDRYGGDVPSGVTTEAALRGSPEWQSVGSGGRWVWHDHRSHLMSPDPLIGMDPGDQLAPQVIELTVDGELVTVEVVTTMQAPPSRWPANAGALVGAVAGFLAFAAGLRSALVAVVAASASVVVGVAQFVSVPSETGPLVTWWLLPTLALGASLCAVWVKSSLWRAGLVALAGLQLLVWGVPRRHVLTRAVVPTELPYWVDRAVTAAVIPTAIALVVVGVLRMFANPSIIRPGLRRLPS